MTVLVTGSRKTPRNEQQQQQLNEAIKAIAPEAKKIIQGGANGADELAQQYARKNNIACETYKPEYRKYGKFAPLKRNLEMIKRADIVIAWYYNEKTNGTRYTVENARKAGKKTFEFLNGKKLNDLTLF